MIKTAAPVEFLGRQREREVLERLLGAARDGRGGVLVIHGEPGIGKTALLEYAVKAVPEFRVARAVGVEGEMELAFAALQQLCSPSLDLMEHLPDPQRDALEVALGLSAGRQMATSSCAGVVSLFSEIAVGDHGCSVGCSDLVPQLDRATDQNVRA